MCQLYYRPLHSWSYLITSSSTDMANKYHRRQLLLCAAVTQIPLTRSCQQHTFGKCLPPTCSLSNAPTCINMEPEFVLKLLTGGREKKKNTTKKRRKNTINDPLDRFQSHVFSSWLPWKQAKSGKCCCKWARYCTQAQVIVSFFCQCQRRQKLRSLFNKQVTWIPVTKHQFSLHPPPLKLTQLVSSTHFPMYTAFFFD